MRLLRKQYDEMVSENALYRKALTTKDTEIAELKEQIKKLQTAEGECDGCRFSDSMLHCGYCLRYSEAVEDMKDKIRDYEDFYEADTAQ